MVFLWHVVSLSLSHTLGSDTCLLYHVDTSSVTPKRGIVTGKQHAIERPWKYKLFKADCGPLEQYIPKIIPHTPGNSFFYSGYHIHQMILGDSFKKGDTRITLQGHGLKINGKYKLFW